MFQSFVWRPASSSMPNGKKLAWPRTSLTHGKPVKDKLRLQRLWGCFYPLWLWRNHQLSLHLFGLLEIQEHSRRGRMFHGGTSEEPTHFITRAQRSSIPFLRWDDSWRWFPICGGSVSRLALARCVRHTSTQSCLATHLPFWSSRSPGHGSVSLSQSTACCGPAKSTICTTKPPEQQQKDWKTLFWKLYKLPETRLEGFRTFMLSCKIYQLAKETYQFFGQEHALWEAQTRGDHSETSQSQSHSHSTAPRDGGMTSRQREPCTVPAPYTKANHPSIIFSPRTPRICGETEKMCVSTASTMQAMKRHLNLRQIPTCFDQLDHVQSCLQRNPKLQIKHIMHERNAKDNKKTVLVITLKTCSLSVTIQLDY